MNKNEVKSLRVKAGLTQKELAEKAGVSRAVIASIEGGTQRSVRETILAKLEKVLKPNFSSMIENSSLENAIHVLGPALITSALKSLVPFSQGITESQLDIANLKRALGHLGALNEILCQAKGVGSFDMLQDFKETLKQKGV